ncbi:DNA-directed RNA polymerase ii subunit rpb4 [Anaeramoeba ignava]|uniref:DNA-directed RNA polymerase ii subunit rpb4 n=1 Tax=Anaeramoeba ignava TaxID=1746090 RepID=A0A9Q0LMZ3_ANAIG|nr:DNA-directed RNA polymerase ii subunit rpb4 [Anaeramoeba ignava]
MSEIEIPKEFEDKVFLTNSEVLFILKHKNERMINEQNETQTAKEGQIKTMEYLKEFDNFHTKEAVTGFRNTGLDLEPYELVYLANLAPETYDEAISLIPSLKNYDDEKITSILDSLSKYMNKNQDEYLDN